MRKVIKTYEGFFKFNKSEKWEKHLDKLDKNYKKAINLHADHDENDERIQHKVSWWDGKELQTIYLFKKKSGNRVYYNFDTDETIDDKTYNHYSKIITKISDYLDKTENVSSSTIDDILNISKEEIEYIKVKDDVRKNGRELIKDYLNKKLPFTIVYNYVTSNTESTEIIKDTLIKIKDIDISDVYTFKLDIEFENKNYYLYIHVDSNSEYIDYENLPFEKRIRLQLLKAFPEELSRAEERKMKTQYPKIMLLQFIPNEYKSIEFIKYLQNVMKELQDHFNNNERKNNERK